MAWNFDPDSNKGVLLWFRSLRKFRTEINFTYAKYEFSPLHPVLPRLHVYIFYVDLRVNAVLHARCIVLAIKGDYNKI